MSDPVAPGESAGPAASAAMTGSAVAGPTAALWVTDFLNAAYYARDPGERSLADLRLARAILATAWHRDGYRRLTARDLARFHRAFGADRFRSDGAGRGRLGADELLAGGARLLGDWFAEAAGDPGRRGFGVVFEDAAALAAFEPERRLDGAPLGALSPPAATDPTWHTYPPVQVASAAATTAALLDPPRWPDHGTALGQFTPTRQGGLEGQTFEIEIVIAMAPRAPMLVRAYVTCTRVLTEGAELEAWAAGLNEGLARHGDDAVALPPGARALAGVELTTHVGHVMGAATSNVLLFEEHGEAFLRDVGCWDPMPLHLDVAYRTRGAEAQRAFWGGGHADENMLRAFATTTA